MKKCVISLALFMLVFTSQVDAEDITIRLDLPSQTGAVEFVLYDSANTFGDLRDPFKIVKYNLDGRELYSIKDVPPGEYAILAYYDENGNGLMDRNFIGIPREPVGFSNNYKPKGPPSYAGASFIISEGEAKHFDVELSKPLGKFGRIGVGVGMIYRSSPYRDYDGGVYQFIPAVTYTGERLQILGPRIQLGIIGSGALRLAAIGQYRIGVYEEDDSEYLEGMGDSESTLMLGFALQSELPGGFDLSASYTHDSLDRIGGGEAQLQINKSFQAGVFRLSPELGLNWLSSELANNDFGVSVSTSTLERPAYKLNSTFSAEVGIGLFVELRRNLLIIMNTSAEFFSNEVKESPIVSEDYVIKSFGAISFLL